MQHISGALADSKDMKELIELSLDWYSESQNLSLYYKWCMHYKRTWSPSFAHWIENQPNILTGQQITEKWKQEGSRLRRSDIQNAADEYNRKMAEKRAEKERGETKTYHKNHKEHVASDGMPW
jgi:hypothetical protein